MAVTFPLTIPATGLASIVMRARSVVSMSASPYTGEQQVQVYPGQWWEMDVNLPAGRRIQSGLWVPFLLKLNGMEGTFLLGDPDGATPQGSAASAPGTPLVRGGGQTGQTLIIDGAPAGAVNYLKAGDYVGLGSLGTTRLHRVLDNASADGSGIVTLSIWPNLRESPADNAAVTVSNCLGLWRLTSNVSEWSIDSALLYGIEFKAIEAL